MRTKYQYFYGSAYGDSVDFDIKPTFVIHSLSPHTGLLYVTYAFQEKIPIMQQKAVVLLSGGLDSSTVLAIAHQQGFELYAIAFDYGQRHQREVNAAAAIARHYNVLEQKTVHIDLRAFGGSALTSDIAVPHGRSVEEMAQDIPITYVPARNTIFLSFALAYAEVSGANDIFLGINAIDYSGYPDCRPAYLEAFERMANLATKAAVQDGRGLRIHAPLMYMNKAEIIRKGLASGVP